MALYKKLLQSIALSTIFFVVVSCEQNTPNNGNSEIEDLSFCSVVELMALIQDGRISSLELLNHYLERIERFNDDINAVVSLDIERARARAEAADQARAAGESWGPLHGLPMTVKDVFEVAGMPTTSGDPELRDYIPENNAYAVQRLIDAGAIIFGKTNVPYHANDWQSYNEVYGTTNNPWDLERTPGGSSGGAAAALAAGFTPLELGSDIGGSIRVPSHFTGVYGHKPTFGIIPRYGHIPPMPGTVPSALMRFSPLWVVGPMARSVDDLELALEVLTTPSNSEDYFEQPALLPKRRDNIRDYRVAVWLTDESPDVVIDNEVLENLSQLVDTLREAGITVDEQARPDFNLEDDIALYNTILDITLSGSIIPSEILDQQHEQWSKWAEFFTDYDVLLTPITPTVAFPHNHEEPFEERHLVINGESRKYLYNLTWMTMAVLSNLPATSVPIGFSESGLPMGVQIIGPNLEDITTLDFARELSQMIGEFTPPPRFR